MDELGQGPGFGGAGGVSLGGAMVPLAAAPHPDGGTYADRVHMACDVAGGRRVVRGVSGARTVVRGALAGVAARAPRRTCRAGHGPLPAARDRSRLGAGRGMGADARGGRVRVPRERPGRLPHGGSERVRERVPSHLRRRLCAARPVVGRVRAGAPAVACACESRSPGAGPSCACAFPRERRSGPGRSARRASRGRSRRFGFPARTTP